MSQCHHFADIHRNQLIAVPVIETTEGREYKGKFSWNWTTALKYVIHLSNECSVISASSHSTNEVTRSENSNYGPHKMPVSKHPMWRRREDSAFHMQLLGLLRPKIKKSWNGFFHFPPLQNLLIFPKAANRKPLNRRFRE